MDYQEWEFFEAVVKSDTYAVTDHGPLHGPVTAFVVRRNKRLDLMLESTSVADSSAGGQERPANAVYRPDGQVCFRHRYTDATATARYVSPGGYSETALTADGGVGTKVQTSKIGALYWTNGSAGEPSYVMDWIGNLSDSFMWPDSDNVDKTDARTRTLRSDSGDIIIPSTTTTTRHMRSCARLTIGGWGVVIGKSRAKPEHVKNPGFVLYLGSPDEETRARIRGCLSFCLGDYLAYLGSTAFDAEWKPVSFCAVSAPALVEVAHRISGRPPAPLGLSFENEVSAALLSQMASALFDAYETYNLRTAFWNYWHAIAAPVHMVAAHFGAAIEALKRTYFDNAGTPALTRIAADEGAWANLREQINQCVEQSPLSADEKRMLGNKVQHLNAAPQSVLSERFFTAIGLAISALEADVWKNRNRAAHGAAVSEDRSIQTIRENKVMMMLMNRILLRVSGAGDHYYDYYTLNRPVRRLSELVPDDRSPRGS